MNSDLSSAREVMNTAHDSLQILEEHYKNLRKIYHHAKREFELLAIKEAEENGKVTVITTTTKSAKAKVVVFTDEQLRFIAESLGIVV